MPDCRRHPPDLPILSFNEFERDPCGRDDSALTDWRQPRWNVRLRIQQPRPAGQGLAALGHYALLQFAQTLGRWDSLHLRPIDPCMAATRMQQSLVQLWFVAKQQEPFRVRVQAPNRIHALGKSKFRERAVGGTIRRKLRNDLKRLVECQQHAVKKIEKGSRRKRLRQMRNVACRLDEDF